MEYFEKAHISKRESSKKEHKSEEATKKQLKQLLYGYKQSDSKLIRECEEKFDPNSLLDESSSVSGYSDLNLTNSSNEGDATRCTVSFDSDDCKNSDLDEASFQNADNDKYNTSGSLDLSNVSVSEYDDKNENSSDSISAPLTTDSKLDTSFDVSTDSSIEDTSTENDLDDSEFDADGALANQILENLKKKDETKSENEFNESAFEIDVASTNKRSKKQRNKHQSIENEESEFDIDGALATKILEKLKVKSVANKKGKKRKLDTKSKISDPRLADKQKFINNPQTEDTLDNISQNSNEKSNSGEDPSDSSMNVTNSPEFVSIAPINMPTQSLMEILGDYNHPTVHNLPESQNLHSTDNSGLFSVEDLNIEDIEIEDDNQTLQDDNIENIDPRGYEIDTTELDDINYSSDVRMSYVTSESTSYYDDTLQSEGTSEKELSLESDDDFVSPVKVFYGNSNCVFVLKHPAELYIHGKVTAKAVVGTMEIFGHKLQDKPCEIYAVNYNYALCLNTVGEENDRDSLFTKLRSEGLSVSDAEDIMMELGEFDGVVSLKKLSSNKIDFVEANITPTDLFSKTSKNVEKCFKRASDMLGCSLYLTRPYKVFEDVPCWREFVQLGFEKNSRGIICGGKGVGKSTFLRYSVNRLLARGPVLVVDLDPGQAEFTPAGNISATVVDRPLLGPSFTHLMTPNVMLNIGMINTMDNPRRYTHAVSALIAHCNNNNQLKSMPWIVNTMGMCNAMGLKFITKVILQTQPTYLLQINTKNPKKKFDTLLNKENVMKLYEDFYNDSLFKDIRHRRYNLDYSFIVEDHTKSTHRNFSMAPRDERYLNFLAYFSQLLSSRQHSLLGITPYEVNLKDLKIGLNVKISDEDVAKVINGKIIALCQQTTDDNARRVFTLKDKPLLCHGHGLIRGLEKEILYVITPTPVDILSLVDTLVYADWVPELRGQEKNLPDGVSIPYRAVTMYQKRQLMFAPRRRFNPLQLLKMTRNS